MKRLTLLVLTILVVTLSGCKGSSEKESLTLTGSTTVLPIAQKCAEVYMLKNKAKITVNGGGSGNGIAALLDGRTEIANASRNIKDKEVKKAKEMGISPYEIMVAKDALAVVINKEISGIDNISIDDLKKIYKGEIKNWNKLGGPNAEITVISRDTSSGTFETFEKKVMKKEKVLAEAQMLASNKAVARTVSTTPNSVGYVGIGYITDKVKVITVEGVKPTNATALDGSYKISRGLFMYTNGAPEGAAKNFLDFVLSTEGQKIVADVGFVPLS